MDAGKLNELVARKNEQLEEEALNHARQIINDIAREQQRVQDSAKRISELQAELKALNITSLDPKTILGQ